jgi:hypothetical protein
MLYNKKKPGNGKDLIDLEVEEISLVDAPASRKKWAMKKSAKGESLEELLHFLQDEGSEKNAMQKAEVLGNEDFGDYLESLSVLKKYDGYLPGEILDALAVLIGLCPQLQKAKVTPIAKFGQGGGLDFLLEGLMLGSRNPRMINSLLKAASVRGELEDADEGHLEDDVAPGQRGVSKAARGQEESFEDPKEGEDHWPSL